MIKRIFKITLSVLVILSIIPTMLTTGAEKVEYEIWNVEFKDGSLEFTDGDDPYTEDITFSYDGTEAEAKKDVTITSKNTKVVTVSDFKHKPGKGQSEWSVKITIVGSGTTSLEIKSKKDSSRKDSCTITVNQKPLDKNELSELGKAKQDNLITAMFGWIIDLVEWTSGFDNIRKSIRNSGSNLGFFTSKTQDNVVSTINKVFLPFAYAILLISWAISLSKKSIALDIYEGKSFIKYGVQLIAGFICIGFASELFELLRSVEIGMISNILSESSKSIKADFGVNLNNCVDDTWVIGPIITFFKCWGVLPQAFTMTIINLIAYIILEIVITFRAIKICIYQGVSPIFMGLAGSESAGGLSKNFIIQYLRLLLQGVVMAIFFFVYEKIYFSGVTTTILNSTKWSDILIYAVITILLPFMILSSEKFVDKMIGR